MKILVYTICIACLVSCKNPPECASERTTLTGADTPDQQKESNSYPLKIETLLQLVETIQPATNPQDFYSRMDAAGIGPKDEDFTGGGGDLGRSWETLDLSYLELGDEYVWALNLEYYSTEPRSIWEAKVFRTPSNKPESDHKADSETIFPYYLKGHAMWKEVNPWEVEDKNAEQGSAGQPATRPVLESDGFDKPQPEAEGRSR
jgi:hypothetical protein